MKCNAHGERICVACKAEEVDYARQLAAVVSAAQSVVDTWARLGASTAYMPTQIDCAVSELAEALGMLS
jgi:hypothetical protein